MVEIQPLRLFLCFNCHIYYASIIIFIMTLGLYIQSSRPLSHNSQDSRAYIFSYFENSVRLSLESLQHYGPAFRDPTDPILSLNFEFALKKPSAAYPV